MELPVEGLQGGEVQFLEEELIAHGPEKPFDLSFGGAVPTGVWHRTMPRRAQIWLISWPV